MAHSRPFIHGTTLIAAIAALCSSCSTDKGAEAQRAAVPPPPKPWTVMVFMNGKNNLEQDALDNFRQMASVPRPSDNLNLVVEFGRLKKGSPTDADWGGVKRYLVKNGSQSTASTAVMDLADARANTDMGAPATLSDFLEWSRANYPAQHYMLVIWNHGQGWRIQTLQDIGKRSMFVRSQLALTEIENVSVVGGYRAASYDDETGNFLYNSDIEEQLKKWSAAGPRLDVIGFDACLMAMIETGYAFRDVASVMVGSQELEPGSGWDYSKWLPGLVSNPSMSGQELASAIVESYKSVYGDSGETTLSAVGLDKIPGLVQAMKDFATALKGKLAREVKKIREARKGCTAYGDRSPDTPFVDLKQFLLKYAALTTDQALKAQAQRVIDLLAAPAILDNYASEKRKGNYGSYGVSIYFPSDKAAFNADHYHRGYVAGNTDHRVDYVDDGGWADFLQAYLNAR